MSISEEFIAYLEGKNIDAKAFKLGDADTYIEWEEYFSQVHPKSFTSQKFYLINNIRRRFQLPEGAKPKTANKKAVAKPSVKVPTSKSGSSPKVAIPSKKTVGAPKIPSKKPEGNTGEEEVTVPKKAIAPKIPGVKKSPLPPKIPSKKSEGNTEQEEVATPKKALAPKIPGAKKSPLAPKIPKKKDTE